MRNKIYSKSTDSSLKLSEQRWYKKSSDSLSILMDTTRQIICTTTGDDGDVTISAEAAAVDTTTSNPYSKSSNHESVSPKITTPVTVTLPELLVLELHRDGSNAIYRNYTIRGLYRYVLDAIADRTGILQAAAVYQHWTKESQHASDETRDELTTIVDSATTNPSPAYINIEGSTTFTIPESTTGALQPESFKGKNNQENHGNTVTYRERLGGYLHPRDMRRLVTAFSTSNEPEIIVRRHVILLNYDPLRAIILRDRLLVLVPDGADSLLSRLEQRVRGGNQDVENSIFGANSSSHYRNIPPNKSNHIAKDKGLTHNVSDTLNNEIRKDNAGNGNDINDDHDDTTDEWNEMTGQEWVQLPFELQCADAVLHVVATELQEETNEVLTAALLYTERIVQGGHGLHDDPLTIIRAVKDAVQLMHNRVKSFAQSLNRMLDDDEDMALMNLSRLLTHPERFVQPVPQRILNEESDEPELILESNLQIALTLTNYLDVIQGQIHTAKELIDQRLDATRNKILFANMLISVFTLCVTLATLVGSFFGMNLQFPGTLHENEYAFNQVIWYTCLGCIIICILIMLVLMYTDTIPSRLCHNYSPIRIDS